VEFCGSQRRRLLRFERASLLSQRSKRLVAAALGHAQRIASNAPEEFAHLRDE
jgi:hypothetical protein